MLTNILMVTGEVIKCCAIGGAIAAVILCALAAVGYAS